MRFLIQPALVARELSADAVRAYTVFDNQRTRATWFYQFGRMVTPAAVEGQPEPHAEFIGIDGQAGNLEMRDADYTAWDGTPAGAEAWLCSKLNLTPATP